MCQYSKTISPWFRRKITFRIKFTAKYLHAILFVQKKKRLWNCIKPLSCLKKSKFQLNVLWMINNMIFNNIFVASIILKRTSSFAILNVHMSVELFQLLEIPPVSNTADSLKIPCSIWGVRRTTLLFSTYSFMLWGLLSCGITLKFVMCKTIKLSSECVINIFLPLLSRNKWR